MWSQLGEPLFAVLDPGAGWSRSSVMRTHMHGHPRQAYTKSSRNKRGGATNTLIALISLYVDNALCVGLKYDGLIPAVSAPAVPAPAASAPEEGAAW